MVAHAALAHMLSRPYYKIAAAEPEFRAGIVAYVRETPTIADTKFDFARSLTGAAHAVLCADKTSLDGLLERLYQFDMETAQMAEHEIRVAVASHDDDKRRQISGYIPYDRAGDAAWAIFENNRNPQWAISAYEAYIRAGEISANLDREYSVHFYRNAGDAANALSKITRRTEWLRAAISCYDRFLRYYYSNNGQETLIDVKTERLINAVRQNRDFVQHILSARGPQRKGQYPKSASGREIRRRGSHR